MACHTTTRSHASGKAPTDIVTYRYNGVLVYVPVASSYNQALSHARDAFPQLKPLHDGLLSLSLTAPLNAHAQQCVGISALAWPKLIAHLARYQIIDVHAHAGDDAAPVSIPHITITYADADAGARVELDADVVARTAPVPPYYPPGSVDDEKASCGPLPRSSRSPPPTPSMLHSGKRNWFLQKLHGQC